MRVEWPDLEGVVWGYRDFVGTYFRGNHKIVYSQTGRTYNPRYLIESGWLIYTIIDRQAVV